MKRWKHVFENFAFGVLSFVVRATPRAAAAKVATRVGFAVFDVARLRRDVAVRNVEERLDPPGGRAAAERIARESYAVMARTFVDLIRLDRNDDDTLWNTLSRSEFEWAVPELVESGRGAVLVSGHFGNWELLVLAIRRMGVKVHAMAADQANRGVNRHLVKARLRAGIRTFSARRGLRQALAALAANESVATLMDQDARRKGIFLDFLGAPSATHTGVVSMAIRSGVPLIPGVLLDEHGRYRFVRGETWFPREGIPDEENLRDGAMHFNRFLEKLVRAHPENYLWAHRRWKTRPSREPAP